MELTEKEKRYKQALISLLPRGKIWQVKPGTISDILLTVNVSAKRDDQPAK